MTRSYDKDVEFVEEVCRIHFPNQITDSKVIGHFKIHVTDDEDTSLRRGINKIRKSCLSWVKEATMKELMYRMVVI